VGNLDAVGEMEQADRDRDRVTAEAGRNAAAVPTGEDLLERLAHPAAEPQPVGHLAGRDAVGDEDPLERPLPGHGELGAASDALERRASSSDMPHRERAFLEPGEVHIHAVPPEHDVVAEPVGELGGSPPRSRPSRA
jgi:hypothetical protein